MKKMHGLFLVVTALAFVMLQDPAEGDPRATAINLTCGTQRNHNITLYVSNFVSTMENISSQIRSSGFGVAVAGSGPDASYGLAQCYGDLPLLDCVLCYAEARTVLPQCFPFIGGRIFLDGCFMRSENYSFFDEFAGAQDIAVCGNTSRKGSAFAEPAKQAVLRAVEAAPSNKGYARTHQVAEHESAYVLADCWKTLNESSCTACLEEASASVLRCLPWSEGRALSTGCFIRYSDTDFLNQEPTNTTPIGSSRATEAALICPNRTAKMSWDRSFVTNFMAALEAVSRLVVTQKYGAVVNTTGTSQLYAYGECMKDLSRSDCDVCFAESKARIGPCLPSQQARVFLDGCYLRYDDYNFFSENLSSEDQTICGSSYFNGGNRTVFGDNVAELVRNLSIEAPKNDGFFTGSVNRGNVMVYGLAQCWETVNRSGCDLCLANAVSSVGSCPPKEDGRVLNAGCYLRYSTNKFYNSNSGNLAAGKNAGRRRLAITLAITSSALAVGLVVAAIVLYTKKKHLKEKRERKQLCPLLSTVDKSNLKFSYHTLENATNSFHISNKLGQGGSGSVYKGILPDGKVVAVKKLFFNTGPWVDHFYNEVNLISCINHKNLVKLLGCSINGPESLLVYEFVPNQSLSDHLFVKGDAQPLSQELRYSIILGIAEGLAYLHEESNLRIIHRDIKLSNVLLEVDFTAKIADFGLARLFPEDETHISTGVAGTIGYMAPEYVVRGKLTEKADVYGFGVLVIEVISGRRNNSLIQGSISILQMVWSLYGKGKLTEAVDPALKGNFQEEEVYRILQIGLLCVQASAELRPSMSTVVQMLTMNQEIPHPTEPPFLTSSSAEPAHNSLLKPTISHPNLADKSQSSCNKMTESWIGPR